MTAELPLDNKENPLSERERDVANTLATGATNAEIARELHISPHTVKVHIRNIFEKLDVGSRTEASMVLIQRGWVTLPGISSAAAAATTTTYPDPGPLSNLGAKPRRWQLVYLLGAILLLLLFIWLPSWVNQARARPEDLLSDTAATGLGQPLLAPDSRWQARTPLSEPRSRMAAVLKGSMLYSIGGENADGTLDAVAAYDLKFNVWQPLAALPEPRANLAAAVFGDAIYIAGGSHDGLDEPGLDESVIGDNFWRYDIEKNVWESAGQLPAPLAGASLATIGDNLYLLGGWDGERMRDEIWRLALDAEEGDPVGQWTQVASLDSPRAFFGATTSDDKLYVVGGYDGVQELSDATLYDLAEGTSQRLSPLTTPRGGLSLVHDGLALYALGGGWTYPLANHERFDPTTGAWSNFPSPIRGVWRHLGAVHQDGRLHLIGGWSDAYLDSHLQYQSSFRALLPTIKN